MARPVKKARVSIREEVTPAKNEELSSSEASSSSSEAASSASEASSMEEDEFDVEELENDSDEAASDEEPENGEGEKKDGFATAIDAILNSRVKAHDRQDPILLRNKKPAREIEDAKLESKARRLMKKERMESRDLARVKDVISRDPETAGDQLQREKKFKKTAQRGVVRLLNAIYSAQAVTKESFGNGAQKAAVNDTKDVSKEKFLDMIRTG